LDALELARHHFGRIDILLMLELRVPALARHKTFITAFTSSISGYAEGDVDQERHSSKNHFVL